MRLLDKFKCLFNRKKTPSNLSADSICLADGLASAISMGEKLKAKSAIVVLVTPTGQSEHGDLLALSVVAIGVHKQYVASLLYAASERITPDMVVDELAG